MSGLPASYRTPSTEADFLRLASIADNEGMGRWREEARKRIVKEWARRSDARHKRVLRRMARGHTVTFAFMIVNGFCARCFTPGPVMDENGLCPQCEEQACQQPNPISPSRAPTA